MKLSVRFSSRKQLKRVIARAIVCGMLLVLPSCQIPDLRPPKPGRDLPDSFNGTTTTDNSAHVTIDEFFDDQILTGLIVQGLAGNQDLKILNENIRIASNEVLARRGAYLPFVSVGGGAGVVKPSFFTPEGTLENQLAYLPGKHYPDPLPNFLMAANVSWQVDIWRQLRNARDAATLRFLGTTEGRNYTVTRLVADIAENYYTLMALDQRLQTLDSIIQLQENSLAIAIARKEAARGTELAVQRFQAEVRKNQSEKLIVAQEIIETENRVNFLLGRFPQPVERRSVENFTDLALHKLSVGVPPQLLQNRPDIRQAERELAAAGLDIKVARANFFPKPLITGGVGWDAFSPKYLFTTPESLIFNAGADVFGPLINKAAIRADYMTANARQLQALYNYQRVILIAFTEVINRITMVENFSKSIEIKKQQLRSLVEAVESAGRLFVSARVEYIDVLFSQRDLMDARMVIIETKRQQLAAIVNAYQALGGGNLMANAPDPESLKNLGKKTLMSDEVQPFTH